MVRSILTLLFAFVLEACTYGNSLNKPLNAVEEKKQGDEALRRNDYQGYLYWYKRAAQLGDVAAEEKVGDIYYASRNNPNGIGSDQGSQQSGRADYYEAEEWYERAVDHGSTGAMVKLATMYLRGEVVAENKEDAAKLFRKASDKGDRRGLIGLAKLEPVIVKAGKSGSMISGALVCMNRNLLENHATDQHEMKPKQHAYQDTNAHGQDNLYPGCKFFSAGDEMVVWGDLENGNISVRLRDGQTYSGVTLPDALELIN